MIPRLPSLGPLLLLVAATLGLVACESPRTPRVILFGIDGADWELLDPMIARGELPGFERLRREGQTGTLLSDYSSHSPAIWNSIATGKLPAHHGITDFLVSSPTSYYEMPVSSYQRRAAALWNILSHHQRRVSAIAWWASWPAEAVNGAVVSQRFFLSSFGVGPIGGGEGIGVGGQNPNYAADAGSLTWPDELSATLGQELPAGSDLAEATELGRQLARLQQDETDPARAHDLAVVDNMLRTDLLVDRTDRLLEQTLGPFDLRMLYFEGTDAASHLFWKHSFPAAWIERGLDLPADRERFAAIIPLYYAEIDRLLGRVLDEAGPEVVVVVVSDHGFRDYINRFDYNYPLNGLLEALGLLARRPDGSIDYAGTRWFDHSGNPWESERRVQLNVAGRYPQGSVDAGQAPQLIDALARSLAALRTDSGERVVLAFESLDDGTTARLQLNPRLEPHDRVRVGGQELSVSSLFPARTLSGNHRPEGIVGFYGGGLPAARLDTLSSLDIAPTVLALLGLPLALDMDGTPAPTVLSGGAPAPASVPSYDFLLASPDGAGPEGSIVDEELKQRLRALGYIR